MDTTLSVAIVAGATGILGSLLSQFIAARYGHKAKRLDTVYARRADAYHELLLRVSELAYETKDKDEVNYRKFVMAYQAARLVSSRGVDKTLCGKEGLMEATWGMRYARDRSYVEFDIYKSGPFHEAMERTIAAMIQDLERLAR